MAVTKLSPKRKIYPVDVTEVEEALIRIMEKIGCSKAEAIRDAIQHYAEHLEGLEVFEYRDISQEEAKKEVEEYIEGKEKVSSYEISEALRIDMTRVNEALMELWTEKKVSPE
jgi:hypothetical protein